MSDIDEIQKFLSIAEEEMDEIHKLTDANNWKDAARRMLFFVPGFMTINENLYKAKIDALEYPDKEIIMAQMYCLIKKSQEMKRTCVSKGDL